ncbi:hypothetical protein HYV30_03525 [Candidatus Kaiserbacteria bacterium]|nr:hypothetical protein [Candidatus Kaiserbacteria bacterium]
MRCIRIVDVPPGEAPEWVREKWVGLILPLNGASAYCSQTVGILSGLLQDASGYVVDIVMSIEILALHAPEAARWWREESGVVEPGRSFVFDERCCVVRDELFPSVLELAPASSQTSVERFLESLDDTESSFWFDKYNMRLPDKLWDDLRAHPLTRPIVLVLATWMRDRMRFMLEHASSESYFSTRRREGKEFLERLYAVAVDMGVRVEREEICQPLTWVDIAIGEGVVEECGEGMIRLTEEGERQAEAIVQAVDRMRNAENN